MVTGVWHEPQMRHQQVELGHIRDLRLVRKLHLKFLVQLDKWDGAVNTLTLAFRQPFLQEIGDPVLVRNPVSWEPDITLGFIHQMLRVHRQRT
jgi:hypothetical protein